MKWKLRRHYTSKPLTFTALYLFGESKKAPWQSAECWAILKMSAELQRLWVKTLNWVENLFCWTENNTRCVIVVLPVPPSSYVIRNPPSCIYYVSNFYAPLISHREPEPPPFIRTKCRRRERETQEGRKDEFAQRGIKQNETSFLQRRHYERRRWNMTSAAASSSLHWFVVAHCCVLWCLPNKH